MDKKGNLFGAGVLVLTPALMFLVFEGTAGSLPDLRGIAVLLNLVFFYMFYLGLFVLCNSSRVTCIALNTLFAGLALGEYYVVGFRYRPVMVWDALSLKTAVSVSANYHYDITAPVAALAAVWAVLSVLAFLFPVKMKTGRVRVRAAAGVLGGSAVFLALFYGGLVDRLGLHVRLWDPVVSYREDGYLLSTMVGLGYLKVQAPEGYSAEAAAGIAERFSESGEDASKLRWASASEITPTHIICIMNESFSDLGEIKEFETNIPYLDYYRSLDENCVKGNLYVPVFGAMTCNTEFEFLTGNALKFAPEGSVPFQLYMRDGSFSLASVLKDQGYETIAMHPYPAANWNRENAYAAMGFDTFLAEEFYGESGRIRDYVSDRADYEKITEVTESRKGKPLFIFNVTMQNHGGYETGGFSPAVWPLGYEGAPKTEEYLSLIRESDEALRYLIEYYEKAEDPTMIVVFGDHRPGIENGFYEYLLGKPISGLSAEEYAKLYATPFLIWTNYDSGYEEWDGLSAQYLSTAVLERAGLKLSGWNYMLDRMSRLAPVVHFLGYRDKNGTWKSWQDQKTADEAGMFREFQIMQYNNMFDNEGRCREFFRARG